MPIFKVPTSYTMTGNIEVEANTLEEAIQYLKENIDDYDLPDNPEYISDSHVVDEDMEYAKFVNRED